MWVKIELYIAKPLLVGAYYKPTENDETGVIKLAKSLDIVRGKGNTTWPLGDYNMPHIDWVTNSPNANCKLHPLLQHFLESLDDQNLDQMVTLPTRGENILDLFCCSNSTLVPEVSVPGISDQCVVYAESSIRSKVSRYKPRKITLYKKADWDGLRLKTAAYSESVLSDPGKYTVQALWTELKAILQVLIYKALYDKSYLGSKTTMTSGEWTCLISFATAPLTCSERGGAKNSK